MIELFKKNKADFFWVLACRAYTVAIVSGAIWIISHDALRICLYIALAGVFTGMAGMILMGFMGRYDDPFVDHSQEISEETMEELRRVIESIGKDPDEKQK